MFSLPDEVTQVEEEVYNYGFSDFVAEAGGYLGMLVGISAVTLCQELGTLAKVGPVRYIRKLIMH